MSSLPSAKMITWAFNAAQVPSPAHRVNLRWAVFHGP